MTDKTLLAVNGTLMRGLELNHNMIAAQGEFVREERTGACYRIWSIGDRHPGMLRVKQGGVQVSLEVWALPMAMLGQLLLSEPAGLCIGKVLLADGSEVLGVLAEPWLVEGQKEITEKGGWREYTGKFHSE
ncbi:amidase [Caballeronia hypogeia]|uniref:Amidase n=1 Tax=Caballeronia hypogeia TaxID=1777140 RepID=A0A158D8V0_9BURK|nr:hypothetical protein [Caballeronia hypogeia]SAK91092.1 amidase [Caballeronia hypogeia]